MLRTLRSGDVDSVFIILSTIVGLYCFRSCCGYHFIVVAILMETPFVFCFCAVVTVTYNLFRANENRQKESWSSHIFLWLHSGGDHY